MSAAAQSDVAAARALRRLGAGIKGTTPAPFAYALRWTASHLLNGAARPPSSHRDASSFELGDAAATLLCSITYLGRRVSEGQLAEVHTRRSPVPQSNSDSLPPPSCSTHPASMSVPHASVWRHGEHLHAERAPW